MTLVHSAATADAIPKSMIFKKPREYKMIVIYQPDQNQHLEVKCLTTLHPHKVGGLQVHVDNIGVVTHLNRQPAHVKSGTLHGMKS